MIEEIVSEYLKPVYSFVFRLTGGHPDSADITQEIFIKVWKNLDRYDRSKGLKPWLFQIARNTTIDWLRKRRSLTFSQLNSPDEDEESFETNIADQKPLADAIFNQAEQRSLLEQSLAKLSLDRRSVILLRHEDNLSFAEIAEVVGKPLNTVKSQYRRALAALRRYLDNAPN